MKSANGHIKTKTFTYTLSLLVVFAIPVGLWIASPTTEYENTTVVHAAGSVDFEERVANIQADVLAQLANCETGGVEEPDGFVRMDSNDIRSWGKYQWQRPSVIHWVKVIYDKDIGLRDAGLIAWDAHPDYSLEELTRIVAFDIEDGIWEWANCAKRHNLDTQVDLINKLRSYE